MAASSHRDVSHAATARERRQAVQVGLATVLAFVVAGMIVVLARHSDEPLTVGEVAQPPVLAGSPSVSAVAAAATRSTSGSSAAPAPSGDSQRSSSARSSGPSATARSSAGSTAAGTATSLAGSSAASSGVDGITVTRSGAPSSRPGGPHGSSPTRPATGSSSPSHSAPGHPSGHPSPTRAVPPPGGGSTTYSASAPVSQPAPPSSPVTTHSTSKPAPPPPPPPSTSTSVAPPPPASSVSISQGGRVPWYRCFARHCYYVAIQLSNFAPGPHTVTCSDSRDGDFRTFTTSSTYDATSCFVHHQSVQVWVTVDGVRSNTLDWNPHH